MKLGNSSQFVGCCQLTRNFFLVDKWLSSEVLMPKTQQDTLFAKRLTRWFAVLATACFIVVPLAVGFLRSRQAGSLLLLMIVFIAPVLLMAFVIQWRVFARYKCPACGALLPMPQRERGRLFEASYYCQGCDIIWETGVRESND